jgi:hypothetical protein
VAATLVSIGWDGFGNLILNLSTANGNVSLDYFEK